MDDLNIPTLENVQAERRGNTVHDFLKMQFVLKVSLKQSDSC